jgi:hypothetical protein
VNNGRPGSTNPCFNSQYEWAKSKPAPVALYVNTANPGPKASNWNLPGPQPCNDPSSYSDTGCAYNYGWNAIQETYAFADSATAGASRGNYWWLDVETMNRWDGSTEANSAIVTAFVDYLTAKGVAGIGIYSTRYQWGKITGGLQFPSLPNWVAGARSGQDAPGFCDKSFTGGPVWLVQYIANNLDNNYVCEAAAAAPPPPPPPPPPAEPISDARTEAAVAPTKSSLSIFDRIRAAAGLASKTSTPTDSGPSPEAEGLEKTQLNQLRGGPR